MAVGGFSGHDPSPTPAQFRADVAAGEIHWFLGADRAGNGTAAQIEQWVAHTVTARTVDGVTVHDLTSPAS